eukprot:bmy_04300T0
MQWINSINQLSELLYDIFNSSEEIMKNEGEMKSDPRNLFRFCVKTYSLKSDHTFFTSMFGPILKHKSSEPYGKLWREHSIIYDCFLKYQGEPDLHKNSEDLASVILNMREWCNYSKFFKMLMRAGAAQKLWLKSYDNNGASEPWLCDLMNSSFWETTVKPAPESSGPACSHPCDFKALMHHLHGCHHNASHTLPTIQDDKNLQPLLETDTRTENGICLLGYKTHISFGSYVKPCVFCLIAFLNITKFIHPLVQALNYNENIHFSVKKQTPNDVPHYIHAISLEGIPNT